MKSVTLSSVKEALNYDNISENDRVDTHKFLWMKSEGRFKEFCVLPTTGSGPHISILFGIDDDGEHYLVHVAMDQFHTHFDSNDDEEQNVEEAFNFVINLIQKKSCLIEVLDKDGKYTGGRVCDYSDETETETDKNEKILIFNRQNQPK